MPRRRKTRAKKANPRYRHLRPFQFKSGQSGNPKGRPKGSRNGVHHELVMNQLLRLMESEQSPAAVRVKAAKLILTIAWGPAPMGDWDSDNDG